jgi:CubicO group peptidase (beta-lactamase class C family)
MRSGNFTVADLRASGDFAQPHADAGGAVTEVPFRDTSWAGPAGSINSGVEEMTRWLQLHVKGGEAGGERLSPRRAWRRCTCHRWPSTAIGIRSARLVRPPRTGWVG